MFSRRYRYSCISMPLSIFAMQAFRQTYKGITHRVLREGSGELPIKKAVCSGPSFSDGSCAGKGCFPQKSVHNRKTLDKGRTRDHIPAFFCGLKDHGIAIDAHGGVPLHNGLSIGGIGVRCPG